MKKRRLWSLLGLLVIASLVLTACGGEEATATPEPKEEVQPTEAPAEPQATEPQPTEAPAVEEATPTALPEVGVSEYKQAPMLDGMDLPPVDERLPPEPVVVPVTESIGQYGGTWYNVTWDNTISNMKMALYDPPVRWKPDYTGYEPGLFEGFEFNDDGTELTWTLREGVRWSDGELFTTEDLEFWWVDMATNEDYGVNNPPTYAYDPDGTIMEVTFPDDYTMIWTWNTPHWITPYFLAQGFWEWEPKMKPAHYLKDFHPTYTPDATYEELDQIDRWWENPDYPVLFAWHVVSYTPAEKTVLERNPYYWKVDPEGNQLPYIDRLEIDIISDEEVRLLELSTGKYNLSFRGIQRPQDIPFLTEQADGGGFHLQEGWMNGAGGWPAWLINQDYTTNPERDSPPLPEDEPIRELLRNPLFRRGLSVAMDRERIIDVAWDGIGIAQNATISPQSPHFASPEGQAKFEEWATAYAEYDPEQAMAWFDEIGFTDQDGDGWRDLPNGDAFELVMDIGDWTGVELNEDATQAYAGNLEDVGIKVLQNNLVGQTDWSVRGNNGLYMLRNCHVSELDIWTYPDWIFPVRGGGEGTRAFPKEGLYRETGGTEGWEIEPGSPAAKLLDIYDRGNAEPDFDKRNELVWEAVDVLLEDGPFTIAASGDQPMPVIVADNVHNVSTYGVLGPWAPGSPGNQHPEQYWIEE